MKFNDIKQYFDQHYLISLVVVMAALIIVAIVLLFISKGFYNLSQKSVEPLQLICSWVCRILSTGILIPMVLIVALNILFIMQKEKPLNWVEGLVCYLIFLMIEIMAALYLYYFYCDDVKLDSFWLIVAVLCQVLSLLIAYILFQLFLYAYMGTDKYTNMFSLINLFFGILSVIITFLPMSSCGVFPNVITIVCLFMAVGDWYCNRLIRTSKVLLRPNGNKFHHWTCSYVANCKDLKSMTYAEAVKDGKLPCNKCVIDIVLNRSKKK